jgi:hypothetical protein
LTRYARAGAAVVAETAYLGCVTGNLVPIAVYCLELLVDSTRFTADEC